MTLPRSTRRRAGFRRKLHSHRLPGVVDAEGSATWSLAGSQVDDAAAAPLGGVAGPP